MKITSVKPTQVMIRQEVLSPLQYDTGRLIVFVLLEVVEQYKLLVQLSV